MIRLQEDVSQHPAGRQHGVFPRNINQGDVSYLFGPLQLCARDLSCNWEAKQTKRT